MARARCGCNGFGLGFVRLGWAGMPGGWWVVVCAIIAVTGMVKGQVAPSAARPGVGVDTRGVVPATRPANAGDTRGAGLGSSGERMGRRGTTPVLAQDGRPLTKITKLEFGYHKDAPGLPSMGELKHAVVILARARDGALLSTREPIERGSIRPKADVEVLELDEIGKPGNQFLYPSALQTISERILRYYSNRNIIGIFSRPDPRDVDVPPLKTPKDLVDLTKVKDLRAGAGPLRIEIWLGRVTGLRTIASGDRVYDPEGNSLKDRIDRNLPDIITGRRIRWQDRVNNPLLEWIKERSPVQASTQRAITIQKEELDNYVLRLNQHPGRHVDVAVTPDRGDVPEAVVLDYLVSESKPWLVYAQASNTGTKQTNTWRERFGYTNNQFTNHDDILSLDYITAGFEDSQAVTLSYETPVTKNRLTRLRAFGVYDQFTASDVGQAQQDFSGDTEQVGLELIHQLRQWRETFLYGVVGARVERIAVENETAGDSAEAIYVLPYVGLRLQDVEETRATFADVTLLGGLTGTSRETLETLGRSRPDTNFVVVQADASHAFFLEPVLDAARFERGESRLAQEVALSLKSQYSAGYRLIPQEQQTAGGFYTVRGYPESVSAGDTVVVASAEYRFHLPRSFSSEPDPKKLKYFGTFRVAPQQAYGRPDWDFIPKAFVDVGYAASNDKLFFERDDALIGAGVGIEFQLKQYLNMRIDWAVALKSIDDPAEPVSAGSNRFHLSFTVLY